MISQLLIDYCTIARKLHRTLVTEEHFEFAIRAAHTVISVKISISALHSTTSARLLPQNRHTTATSGYSRHSAQAPVHTSQIAIEPVHDMYSCVPWCTHPDRTAVLNLVHGTKFSRPGRIRG